MKNKIYFFLIFLLLFEIFISQSSSNIIKQVFPFYPYNDNMVIYFKEFCLKMNSKEDCMIEIIKKMDIQKINKISYDFIKSYNNKEESSEIIQNIFFNSLNLLTFLIQNNILKMISAGAIEFVRIAINAGKKWLNEKNERVILEIKKFLNNSKYQKLIDDNFQKDIDELIEDGISQLKNNQNIDYVEDFFNNQNKIDNNNYLNSIFKGDISSLNFFVLGEKNKTKFIETILERTKKKNNLRNSKSKEKKILKFFEIKSNDDNYFENINKKFDNIIHKEKKFIYGFIYLGNTDSFTKVKALVSLREDHYDKIPIKRINYKNGEENLSKKEFFEFIEELDEKKLKSIYKYYYSLNFYENFKNIIINNNLFINVFSSLLKSDIKNIDAAANLIINKLKLNLNVLLLGPNLDYEDINYKIKSFYHIFFKKLKEDLKKLNKDYTIDENKNWWNLYDLFIDEHPNDIIPIFLYEKISKLIEKVFFKKIKEIIVNHNFNIKYPNYLNIINIINLNIKDELSPQMENNETEYISNLPVNSNNFLLDLLDLLDNKKFIVVILAIIFIIFIIVGLIYCCLKNKNDENKNKKKKVELEEELQDMNNENNDQNQNNRDGFKGKD